jgi:K+-sensing histidine kinase KdpD
LPAKSQAASCAAQHGKAFISACTGAEELSIFPTATLLSAILEVVHMAGAKAKMARYRYQEKPGKRWLRVLGRADALAGGLICGITAVVASVVAGGYSWRVFVPLLFTAVLLLVALVLGARAGIAGTAVAALVFSMLLFNPVGRLQVSDTAARSNLGWMLLIGLSFSLLFAPPTSGFRRH